MALTDLFNDIADAIREKDGTTAEIVASTFPDRIRAIPTGIGGVQLESIAIVNPPYKTYYYEGDEFDPTGMTVYANYSNGQSLYVNLSNLTFTPSGPLSSETSSITVNFQWGIKMVSTSQPISIVTVSCFGVAWDYSDSSPELTRLTPDTDPNGYVTATVMVEPSPAVHDGSGSSPFDTYMPWSGMEEYNIVNGVVSYKKGDENFNRSSDTFVYIPIFYSKIVDDETNKKRYYYVSDKLKSGLIKHPGSGKYIARYLDNVSDTPGSKTGTTPIDFTVLAGARERAKSRGSGWQSLDIAVWSACKILFTVEFATKNSQAALSSSSSSFSGNGITDTMSYHTGVASTGDIQYRGIENLFGARLQWTDGLKAVGENLCYSTGPANYNDGENSTGYINSGKLDLYRDGELAEMGTTNVGISGLGVYEKLVNDWLEFPNSVLSNGNYAIYLCDYIMVRMYSGTTVGCYCFGGYSTGSGTGLYGCYTRPASNTSTSVNYTNRFVFVAS